LLEPQPRLRTPRRRPALRGGRTPRRRPRPPRPGQGGRRTLYRPEPRRRHRTPPRPRRRPQPPPPPLPGPPPPRRPGTHPPPAPRQPPLTTLLTAGVLPPRSARLLTGTPRTH